LGRSFSDGTELSGGQWQKMALGRAMMRPDPLLLVLDEPTASVDAETEHALFERYAAAAQQAARANGGVTVLVSHRFSTVRMADLILVVDGGRVVEIGSHRDLMDGNGLYAELFSLQAQAYR
jgi:ATP-binding cassette subfamily B protein